MVELVANNPLSQARNCRIELKIILRKPELILKKTARHMEIHSKNRDIFILEQLAGTDLVSKSSVFPVLSTSRFHSNWVLGFYDF